MNKVIIYKIWSDFMKRCDQIRLSYNGCYKHVQWGMNQVEVDETIFMYYDQKIINKQDFTGKDVVMLGQFSESEHQEVKLRKPKTITYRGLNEYSSAIKVSDIVQQKKS